MIPLAEPAVAPRALPRPRARSIGAVHLVAAAGMLALPPQQLGTTCAGAEFVGTPAGVYLLFAVVISGLALLLRVPRCSAVAPALAAGAALSLLGGAAAGWVWFTGQSCPGVGFNTPAAVLVLQTGGAIAVLGTAASLLYSRHEFAPWAGAQGVVASTAAAVSTLVIGIGFAVLIAHPAGFNAGVVILAVALPWTLSVAAIGWLRQSPALVVMMSVGLQALWLLLTFA